MAMGKEKIALRRKPKSKSKMEDDSKRKRWRKTNNFYTSYFDDARTVHKVLLWFLKKWN